MTTELDKIVLLAELEASKGACAGCELEHHDHQPRKAIDYLILGFGKKSDSDIAEVEYELTIPICTECRDGLQDKDWVLVYCYNCHANHWILRPVSKNEYSNHYNLIVINSCPKCGDKKADGVWFLSVW